MGIVWDRPPVVTVVAGVFAAYLVLGVPLAGLPARRELELRLLGPGRRPAIYRQAISRLWLLAGIAIATAGLAKVSLSQLGLRAPGTEVGKGVGWLADGVLVIATATTLAVLAGGPPAGRTQSLLPRTRLERRRYLVLALTAGVVEELLYRGFLMLYVTGALGWSVQSAALVSALAFGISHLYQGTGTALVAGIIGYGFAEAYAVTGSLLLPVVVHIALDLRVLLPHGRGQRASVVQQGERALETVA